LVVLIDLFLALIVLDNNKARVHSRHFATFVSCGAFWALGALLMLFASNDGWLQLGVNLFIIAPTFTTLFLVYFVHVFPQPSSRTRLHGLLALPALLITTVCLLDSGVFIDRITTDSMMNEVLAAQPGYLLYSLYFTAYLGYACFFLWTRIKSHRGRERAQLAYSLTAVVVASTVSGASNLLLPNAGHMSYVWIGPLTSVFFAFVVSVAIIKHRLFDVRLVVARSLAYALSVVVLVIVYVVVSLFIVDRIFGQRETNAVDIKTVVLLVLAAASFSTIRHFFDHVTNRIFYRDMYNPEVFLDQFNKALVSNSEPEMLLNHASRVIVRNLRAEFCSVSLGSQSGSHMRLLGSVEVEFTQAELQLMYRKLPGLRQKIVAAEDASVQHSELGRLLLKKRVAVVACLRPATSVEQEPLAYLLLGSRKSGNAYNKKDLNVIEIVSDQLAIAIQSALRFEEIQDFNTTLQSRVEDATAKLKRVNHKLQELDATKDEFISMASHQLRTPLTSVKGYLSMVLEGDGGKLTPVQKRLLGQAYVSSQRMVYLISDLLNVSRLKTGKFIINAEPTSLADIVASEIGQLSETAKSKQITLTYDKPKNFPTLELDETKMRQVIMNFVDNAIYYTQNEGKIHIGLTSDKHHVYFTVKDNGLGVPKEEQARLFTKFYRASNARKARPDGTGLGLFMAKRVVAAQGGSILFESVEDKGSTFGFTFELKDPVPETPKSIAPAL